MTSDTTQDHRDHIFLIGLVAGTCIGAGLAVWLIPRAASELRQRVVDSARELSTHVDEAAENLTARGRGVRDDVADAVVRGAHEATRIATGAKTGRATEPATVGG